MNLIARGEAAQRNWRTQHLTDDATYARGIDALLAIKATKGSTRTTVTSRDGAMQAQSRIVDFVIDVDQLVTIGEPRVGDRITHLGSTYEVCHGIDGVRAWAWSGRDNLTYRIHTLQITPPPTNTLTVAITSAARGPIFLVFAANPQHSANIPIDTWQWTLTNASGRVVVATWHASRWTVADTFTGPTRVDEFALLGDGDSFQLSRLAFSDASSVELLVTATDGLTATDTRAIA